MAKQTRPEYSWDDGRQCWYKQIRGTDGKYVKFRAQTKPELRDMIRQYENDRDAGLIHHSRMTVRDVAEMWRPVALDGLAHNSQEAINNALDNHVIPQIGECYVKDVRPADIDAMMLTLSDMSSSLQAKVLVTARRVIDYAIDNGYALKNPCKDKKPKGKEPKKVVPLTEDQQTELLEAVSGTRAHVLVALLIYTGVRREEAIALAWSEVYLDTVYAFIRISHAVYFEGQRPIRTDKLKTKAAYRDIPIPDALKVILAAEKEKGLSEYVICDINGNLCSLQAFRNLWKLVTNRYKTDDTEDSKKHPYCKKTLDFRANPHQLRHTYITNLCAKSAETGLDIKTIQYLAGHSNPMVTLKIYSHVMNSRQTDTAEKIKKMYDFQPVQDQIKDQLNKQQQLAQE